MTQFLFGVFCLILVMVNQSPKENKVSTVEAALTQELNTLKTNSGVNYYRIDFKVGSPAMLKNNMAVCDRSQPHKRTVWFNVAQVQKLSAEHRMMLVQHELGACTRYKQDTLSEYKVYKDHSHLWEI